MLVIGKKKKSGRLYEAIAQLQNGEECYAFFQDLCSTAELRSMEQRFEVASLLDEGMVYSGILKRTGASTATISRVSRSLTGGTGGYSRILARMREKEPTDGTDREPVKKEKPGGEPVQTDTTTEPAGNCQQGGRRESL